MDNISIDVWLYGGLARFAGDESQGSYAHLQFSMPVGTTVSNLLTKLGMPSEERGISFINGQLSAMPGVQPDLETALRDGDRVAFFDQRSMWPFQYRHGASITKEMKDALHSHEGHGLHHSYKK